MHDEPTLPTGSLAPGNDDVRGGGLRGSHEKMPEWIGAYRVREVLGEGGFGVVYLAEQSEPVQRRVAVKVIKAGMDSKAVLARFEAERQALAVMDHPGIAQIFDGGTTESGLAYFAMELVRGESITAFCDKHKQSIRQRLELFQQVCGAVQHAHMKGVIHRDLKPSNILVRYQGDEAQAKVIDFGVAKALHQKLSDATVYTEQGQLIGTPAYMSPEQAEMSAQDIDTRSDVYSLGVVLYELLSGELPFSKETLRDAGVGEIQRIIREVEPAKPSTKVSTDVEHSREIAERRRTESRSLAGVLKRDLDWVVMKCLEKDRARRYETANALAMELERYLKDEPVLAGPPSVGYRMGKFVKRNRAGVIAAVVGLVLLIGGFAGTGYGFVRAEAQRKLADQRAVEAQNQTARAEEAQAEAQTQRDAAHRQSYVANIVAAQANIEAGEIKTARDRLDQAPTELRGWEWKNLYTQLDQSIAVFRGHEGSVQSVAFSPDGARIASAAQDSTVRVWDAESGEELLVLRGPEVSYSSVAFNHDGTRIAAGALDHLSVLLWDAQTGEQLTAFRGHKNSVASVAFSPDGSRVASGSWDETVRVWDAESGEQLRVFRGHKVSVTSIAFSPDGLRIASGGNDGTVRVWDIESGKELVVFDMHDGMIRAVAFSPDGWRIASGSSDRTVRVWEASNGEELHVLRGHEGRIASVAFSPDGSRIASTAGDKTLRVWDAETGEEIVVLRGHERGIESAVFSPDGLSIASGGWGGTVRVWDASVSGDFAVLRGHEGQVYSVAFSPDGSRIVSGSNDLTIRVWDATSRQELGVLRGHEGNILSVAFSPNGSRIASVSMDKTMRVWDVDTGDQILVLSEHEDHVTSVAFSPDGLRIASGSGNWVGGFSEDNTVRLWDAQSGKPLLVLHGHERPIRSVVFSPDGTRIASGSWDGTVRLWDAASGEELGVLVERESWVLSFAFSPDASRIATASNDNTVRMWDATTGKEILVFRGHEGRVQSVAFSPDGSRIVSGSYDDTVRVWDAESGQELRVLRGHEQPIISVAFSPDSSRIASVSWDKTVRVWDTVPYRDRIAERDEARRHTEMIRPLVEDLFSSGLDFSSIAEHVRANETLNDPLRHAAMNLVLKTCSAIRDAAHDALQEAMQVYARGEYDTAEPLLIDALDSSRRAFGDSSLQNMRAIARLAGLYDKLGRVDEANLYLAELAEVLKIAVEQSAASPIALNGFAWFLLTDEQRELRYPQAALPIALAANEMAEHKNPAILDTLALAHHLTGDTVGAIETEKRALSLLSPDDPDRGVYESALARFEAALAEDTKEPVHQAPPTHGGDR